MQCHPVKDLVLAKDKIIVALDVASPKEARDWFDDSVANWDGSKSDYNYSPPPDPPSWKRSRKAVAKVFLDLKFHDIPSTVRQAVRSACALGADMLTIHLCGGSEMCRAAVEGRAESSTLLLGVTVLTSQNDQTLAEVGNQSKCNGAGAAACDFSKSDRVSPAYSKPP